MSTAVDISVLWVYPLLFYAKPKLTHLKLCLATVIQNFKRLGINVDNAPTLTRLTQHSANVLCFLGLKQRNHDKIITKSVILSWEIGNFILASQYHYMM